VEISGDAESESGIALHVATDQVRFTSLDTEEPVPLRDVPGLVFSEVMRDVDLFVGVCSVGNDPSWHDRGEQRDLAYWTSFAFGDLGETAKTRRAVLARLVPKLAIADRCELTDRFLVVRGDLRTYKIHLGSANILMAPNDQYLCIVPDRKSSDARPDVRLPFEGDSILGLVLSKALLLAKDRRIDDPRIVSQIRRA
jgi:hypothetical protein